MDLLAVNDERVPDLGDHLLGEHRRLLRVPELAEHLDDEVLVAAEAGHRVRLPHASLELCRRGDEQGVALGVAERVVDVLEVVEVEQQDGQCPAGAARESDRLREPVVEQAAAGQAGQRVAQPQVARELLGRPTQSDILDRQQDQWRVIETTGIEQHDAPPDPPEVSLDLEALEGGFLEQHLRQQAVQLRDVPLALGELVERAADRGLRLGLEGSVERRIRGPHPQLRVEDEEGLAHRLHDALGVDHRGPALLLCLSPVGDVDERRHDAVGAVAADAVGQQPAEIPPFARAAQLT